jgi:hypothetical protein
MAGAAPSTQRGGSLMWLLGLGCGLLAVLAGPLAALAGVLLLPSLLTWLLDRAGGRAVPRIVLVAGCAMALGPMAQALGGGLSWASSLGMLADIRVVAGAWAVQAAAWLAGELAPLLGRLVLDLSAAAKIARLRAARAQLLEEWRIEPGE